MNNYFWLCDILNSKRAKLCEYFQNNFAIIFYLLPCLFVKTFLSLAKVFSSCQVFVKCVEKSCFLATCLRWLWSYTYILSTNMIYVNYKGTEWDFSYQPIGKFFIRAHREAFILKICESALIYWMIFIYWLFTMRIGWNNKT